VMLDLDTNDLEGTIPRVLGDLENLKFLLLNRNQLSGSIPNSFEQLTKLGKLMSVIGDQIQIYFVCPC
jgi:Leucine rich repeat